MANVKFEGPQVEALLWQILYIVMKQNVLCKFTGGQRS